MHAHLMWTVDSKSFLIDLLLKCSPGSVGGEISCEHDEMALNHALWKAGATHQLCLMDPYYEWFMKAWEDMDLEDKRGVFTIRFSIYSWRKGCKHGNSFVGPNRNHER